MRAQFQCLGQQIAGFNRFRLCDYYYQSLSEFQLRADGFLAAPSTNDFLIKMISVFVIETIDLHLCLLGVNGGRVNGGRVQNVSNVVFSQRVDLKRVSHPLIEVVAILEFYC